MNHSLMNKWTAQYIFKPMSSVQQQRRYSITVSANGANTLHAYFDSCCLTLQLLNTILNFLGACKFFISVSPWALGCCQREGTERTRSSRSSKRDKVTQAPLSRKKSRLSPHTSFKLSVAGDNIKTSSHICEAKGDPRTLTRR